MRRRRPAFPRVETERGGEGGHRGADAATLEVPGFVLYILVFLEDHLRKVTLGYPFERM